MTTIHVHSATQADKEQLLKYFGQYGIEGFAEKRVSTYLDYGFTIVAKDGKRLVGTVQWYVKENPLCGVAEFEEVHVQEPYRGRGIGTLLLQTHAVPPA